MTTDVPERFYEQARAIRNGVIWESNGATRVLAEALYTASKEGAAGRETAIPADVARLVDRLNHITDGDHDRGCDGRTYICSCGFDERTYETATRAAAALEALSAKNERLRKAIERLLASPALADENHSDPEWGCEETATAVTAARRELDDVGNSYTIGNLEAQLAARTGGVKVKALEWKHHRWRHEARTEFGTEVVYEFRFAENDDVAYASWRDEEFVSVEEAKAAAQADYERRVLAALEPAEPAEPFEERILSEEEYAMIDAAWEHHKAAKPQFLPTEDGEFNGNAHVSATDEEEEIAKLIWERFAPAHEVEWPSGNAGEYRQVAKDIVQRFLP